MKISIVTACCLLAVAQAIPLTDVIASKSLQNGGEIPVEIEQIAELSSPIEIVANSDAEAKRKARQIIDVEVISVNGGGGYGGYGGGYGGYGGYGGGYGGNYGGYGGYGGGYQNYGYNNFGGGGFGGIYPHHHHHNHLFG